MTAKTKRITINHFLSDGRKIASIKGYVVPLNDKTKVAYEVLMKGLVKNESKVSWVFDGRWNWIKANGRYINSEYIVVTNRI